MPNEHLANNKLISNEDLFTKQNYFFNIRVFHEGIKL